MHLTVSFLPERYFLKIVYVCFKLTSTVSFRYSTHAYTYLVVKVSTHICSSKFKRGSRRWFSLMVNPFGFPKIFTNRQTMGLLLWAGIRKPNMERKCTDAPIKKVMITVFTDIKEPINVERCNCFLLPTYQAKITLFIGWPSYIYIYIYVCVHVCVCVCKQTLSFLSYKVLVV